MNIDGSDQSRPGKQKNHPTSDTEHPTSKGTAPEPGGCTFDVRCIYVGATHTSILAGRKTPASLLLLNENPLLAEASGLGFDGGCHKGFALRTPWLFATS